VISYDVSSSQGVLKEEVATDDEIYVCVLEVFSSPNAKNEQKSNNWCAEVSLGLVTLHTHR